MQHNFFKGVCDHVGDGCIFGRVVMIKHKAFELCATLLKLFEGRLWILNFELGFAGHLPKYLQGAIVRSQVF